MTIPAWPNLLNYRIDRGSFKVTPSEDNLMSNFDKGPARVRRRFTKAIPRFEFSITMDTEDVQIFKTFYFYTLQNGVNWFTMPVWDGSSYVTHTVRFSEPYGISDFSHALSIVSFKLEAREFNILPEYVVTILGDYSFLLDRLQVIVNKKYDDITKDYE